MSMLRRILVPLDGSPVAEEILVRAGRLLAGPETEVVLAHALYDAEEPDLTRRREEVEAAFAPLAERLAAEGVRCRLVLREGRPAAEILAIAEDVDATLIAMSTHGATGASRWLLGSVCEKVMRRSRRPVLAARSFARGPGAMSLGPTPLEPYTFERLLVPVDGSEASLSMTERVAELAEAFGSEVTLLHVDEGDYADVPARLPWLDTERDVLRERGLTVRAVVRAGQPLREIERAAEELRADLICIASQGAGSYSAWLLGSVAERVLRHARVPVLLVPASD